MYDLALLLHILLLTYWLGADLGVFYSSRYILKPELGTEARATALKIMAWLDVSPRLCLVLFLPSGVTLMALDSFGRDTFSGWPLAAVWVASAIWFGLVLADHVMHDSPVQKRVKQLDLLARFTVITVLLTASIYTLAVDEPFGVQTNPKMTTGSTPDVEKDLRRSIVGSQPYVAAIWLCVVGSALLGLAKPGANI